MKYATTPPSVLAAFLTLGRSQRILIDHIGDSTTLYTDVGYNHGWHGAWHAALLSLGLSWWGTSLWSINNGLTNEASYLPAYKYWPRFVTSLGALTLSPEQGGGGIAPYDVNPPNALGDNLRWGGVAALATWRPHFYGYGKDAAADTGSNNAGILFDGDCPIGLDNDLDAYFWYGTFLVADGTGNFRPGWREETTNAILGMAAVTDPTVPNAYGMTFLKVRKPAASHQGKKLFAAYRIPGQGDINGPFFGTYCQVVNPTRTTGFSISTMLALGGQSAFDLVTAINATPDATIDHYFKARRQPVLDAGQTPKMLIVLNTGVNDRNEPGNSINTVGTNISSAGFIDNVSTLVARLRARWAANGWNAADLFILINVSHPQSDNPLDAGESPLNSYRVAAAAWAASQPNTAVVDWTQLVTSMEMRALDWYPFNDLVANRPHASQAGFEGMATRLAAQAISWSSTSSIPAIVPATPADAMVRDGYTLILGGDASADTLAPMGFVPVQTAERWLNDYRSNVPSGVFELREGDEVEFIFLSPAANDQTGTYLITALSPVFTKEGDVVPSGYIEERREAGALTVCTMAAGAAGAAAIPGIQATDLFVDTITTTLNKAGTEVDSSATNLPASLRVKAQGATMLRVQTAVGTAANGFRVIARRCKGDATPYSGVN